MRFATRENALALFNCDINNSNPLVRIGALEFEPARVLMECDPIAYRCLFTDWCNQYNIETDADRFEPRYLEFADGITRAIGSQSYLRAIEYRANFEQLDERIYYYADDELFTYSTDAELTQLVAVETDLEAQV